MPQQRPLEPARRGRDIHRRLQHRAPLVLVGGLPVEQRRDGRGERGVTRAHRVDDAAGQLRDRARDHDVARLDRRPGGTLRREHRVDAEVHEPGAQRIERLAVQQRRRRLRRPSRAPRRPASSSNPRTNSARSVSIPERGFGSIASGAGGVRQRVGELRASARRRRTGSSSRRRSRHPRSPPARARRIGSSAPWPRR